jgi:hypothetical protein
LESDPDFPIMLAYVFYHWKRSEVDSVRYEGHLRDFHRALNEAPSTGFSSSWCVGVTGAPWAHAGGDSYEDWYLVRGSADLDPLNDAAISASRQAPHDKAASAAAGGTAGLYRLRTGTPLRAPRFAAWLGKPAAWSYGQLYERLQSVTGGPTALWVRQMTLGPALEFCLHSNSPIELPAGIAARSFETRAVFPQGA